MSKLRALTVPVIVLGAAIGCGSKSQMPVELSGTVTYKGHPLPGGYIAFHTDDHGIINTTIRSEGKYEVKLPTDSMRVTIETESLNPDKTGPTYGPETAGGTKGLRGAPAGGESKMKAERMAAEGKAGGGEGGQGFGPAPKEELAKLYMKIPKKYAFKETSGFTLQLEPGKHVKDFELTD